MKYSPSTSRSGLCSTDSAQCESRTAQYQPIFFPSSAQELSKYQGYYFVYLMSPSGSGEVIKSITRLTRSGNKILSKTYERVRLGDDQLKSFGINKYRGFCFASSDLIYIVEHEYLSSRGYIWSALYPPIAVASAFSTAWCSACRATIFDVLLVRRLCLSTSVNRSICVTRSPVAAASRLMPLRYPAR